MDCTRFQRFYCKTSVTRIIFKIKYSKCLMTYSSGRRKVQTLNNLTKIINKCNIHISQNRLYNQKGEEYVKVKRLLIFVQILCLKYLLPAIAYQVNGKSVCVVNFLSLKK